ncbi:hypothetical protein A3C96_01445 [Candidatus Uhrbacteria bacterium RIFCSPHIGHO2_02_FULL_60_10]|uniref:Uncharacterized protein n=1 Tax=Candidatus Uhrbacteria bacterium RIFCSPHIGHO2_02_FULL_60_10 TaxID=1802392 RepID=A0A1F7U6K5_9BACT|nr:MAG: hypothetical protein A3C96_01445 [Candidatus Uhrbacteria bacterium RIFCSPHIGHO2_02_FULL_60_10]
MPKKLLILTTLLNAAYILWLPFHVRGGLGIVLGAAEIAISSLTFILLFNHWTQKHDRHSTKKLDTTVDVFITTVDEPLDLLAATIKSAQGIAYRRFTVYVLDDGRREAVKKIAARHGAAYLSRPDIPRDYKAGNLNFGLKNSSGTHILVLDADQTVTDRKILEDLLGHFAADRKLAMVATRQRFNVPHTDFNNDELFYEQMQTGKNDDNAAISSGSGVIYARQALEKIGGFQTWNIVEDLYTAYVFHQRGFRTLYVNQAYTLGTAPMDLAAIYKQRGTWATDTLRLFFRQNPFLKRGLTFRQKVHYSELALAYLVSAFAITTLFVLPIFTVYFRLLIIDQPGMYLLLRIPSLATILYLYYRLSGNTFSTCQYWAALFPVYLKATILALWPGKPKYKVTPKVGSGKRDTLLALPHLTLIAAAGAVSVRYLLISGPDMFLAVNMVWFVIMAFWCYPLIRKSIYKE